MEKCSVCSGKKVVVGMGAMKEKCSSCDGVGHLNSAKKRSIKKSKVEQKEPVEVLFPTI